MISFNQLSLRRGNKLLFDSANLIIHSGQRAGIIGPNGCGKSSLFKLILGQLQSDNGELTVPSYLAIAHMAQESTDIHQDALNYVLNGDQELRLIEEKISSAMRSGDDNALGHLYAKLETIGGYNAKNRAEQLLHGLGFQQAEITKPVNQFSGGWRIRLNLAQALMTRSDLLLLDEPTNHLDLDATVWLEQWLKAYQGTLILISHDRDFLDGMVDSILSFESAKLILYRGNYSSYERQRAERLAQQQVVFEKQQQRVKEIQSFVNRFRAKATKARQAQSRLKELAKMELIAPAHVDSPFHFRFRESEKMSSPLLHLTLGQLGYSTPVLQNVELSILPGSRIGLLGANGAGKSTLIKTLAGQLPLISGALTAGEHLRLGYFAQHQLEILDYAASPVAQLQRLRPAATEQEIRNFLGGFDFHGEIAVNPITHFSGGEKARLVLALIAWQEPNLLLLDEPTNHLDLEMRHALEVALQEFSGAVIVISHDRHLLRNSVDNFFLVANGSVQEYEGDLAEYQKFISGIPRDTVVDITNQNSQPLQNKVDKKVQRQQAAELRKKLNPLTNKIKKLESAMEEQQRSLTELEEKLLDNLLYQESAKSKLAELLQKQTQLKNFAHETEEQWLAASEELEVMEQEIKGLD